MVGKALAGDPSSCVEKGCVGHYYSQNESGAEAVASAPFRILTNRHTYCFTTIQLVTPRVVAIADNAATMSCHCLRRCCQGPQRRRRRQRSRS